MESVDELASARMPSKASFVWYWTLLVLFFWPTDHRLSVAIMVILAIGLSNGAHETVHNTLVPRGTLGGRQRWFLNSISGVVGYAIVGHNFLLIRYSHFAHHLCGRRWGGCTLDGGGLEHKGLVGVVRYYLLLFGLGQFLYEIAGYLYVLVPGRWISMYAKFPITRYGVRKYLVVQLIVVAVTIVLILTMGWERYVLFRLCFAIYWGFTQNAAHYRLPIGTSGLDRYASKSYLVSRWLDFALFGSPFHHLAHHVFPGIPGTNLHQYCVRSAVAQKLRGEVVYRLGVASYIVDFLSQLKGLTTETQRNESWIRVPKGQEGYKDVPRTGT